MNDITTWEAIWKRLHHLPPIGYRVDIPTRRFVPEQPYFEAVRRMFNLALEGLAVSEILRTVNAWGFRTPVHGKIGGSPLVRRKLYYLLQNPFYAGKVRVGDEWRTGLHDAVVSVEEFERVQRGFRRRKSNPKKSGAEGFDSHVGSSENIANLP